ncbi:hypothetical protein RFI_02878 [Reticulomyxa filosa]|uniref:Uncharacterized protein n=1 Tax=Reticulomyxa filosa TaxID=46433 RepID=X6P9A1_RETFI|nr:hypothetical protein RFI_02878 [Reticulomyxa filosa]|eukprot:ETO34217.1 hypothetical protein RFI_02878 [Reticulomyxa filosa]
MGGGGNLSYYLTLIPNSHNDEADIHSSSLSLQDIIRRRVNGMNNVYKKLQELENRLLTTGSEEYLRGLTEIRELQSIINNQYLKHFFTRFVTKANQIFNDLQLASISILEPTITDNSTILELEGIKTLLTVLKRNKRNNELTKDIGDVMKFVQAIPDREIVIMQVARHLALATPYKQFITGKHRPKSMIPPLPKDDNRDPNNSYVILDLFVNKLLEEWIGSICNVFGTATSVTVALENDIIAQVRPNNAAKLIVNSVWGLDGTL